MNCHVIPAEVAFRCWQRRGVQSLSLEVVVVETTREWSNVTLAWPG